MGDGNISWRQIILNYRAVTKSFLKLIYIYKKINIVIFLWIFQKNSYNFKRYTPKKKTVKDNIKYPFYVIWQFSEDICFQNKEEFIFNGSRTHKFIFFRAVTYQIANLWAVESFPSRWTLFWFFIGALLMWDFLNFSPRKISEICSFWFRFEIFFLSTSFRDYFWKGQLVLYLLLSVPRRCSTLEKCPEK